MRVVKIARLIFYSEFSPVIIISYFSYPHISGFFKWFCRLLFRSQLQNFWIREKIKNHNYWSHFLQNIDSFLNDMKDNVHWICFVVRIHALMRYGLGLLICPLPASIRDSDKAIYCHLLSNSSNRPDSMFFFHQVVNVSCRKAGARGTIRIIDGIPVKWRLRSQSSVSFLAAPRPRLFATV